MTDAKQEQLHRELYDVHQDLHSYAFKQGVSLEYVAQLEIIRQLRMRPRVVPVGGDGRGS